MTLHLGNVDASSVLYIPFHTFNSSGASVTISGLAVTDIEIYKDGSATPRSSDNGYTLLDTDGIDFASKTGIHGFSVDLSDNTDAGFYAAGSFYWVVVSSITVDSQTVSFVIATFRIGPAAANVTQFGGTAGTFSGGRPEVNTTHAAGTAWGSGAITAASIATGAIDADAIADNAIDAGAIASDAITSAKIADSAITANKIAADAITAAKIADGAIDAGAIAADAITAAKIADGAIDANTFAAGAITASAIAADAIGASELAADAIAEIADAVWDEDATAHQTQGTFGQAIGDPGADTDTIFGLVNTNLNATVSSRASQTSLDTVDDFLDTEIAAILTDTNELQTDWVNGGRLDLLIDAIKAKTDNLPTDPADASDIASSFTSLNTKVDTIDDFLDTEVAAIKAVTDLLTAAHAEPTGAPAADETPLDKLAYIYMALRNKLTVTSSAKSFYDDAGNVEWSKALSDNGTTYTEDEGA